MSQAEASLDEMWDVTGIGETPTSSSIDVTLANGRNGTYSRAVNATVEVVERKVQYLEGRGETVAVSSGMAAVTTTLLSLLQARDTLVVHCSLFFGVTRLMDDYLSKLGIRIRRVDMRDPDQLRAALAEPSVRAAYFEPICNPDLSIVNALAVAKAARDAGVLCIIDNTVLTPCFFRPLAIGADVVLHSASKFLGGHGDAIGGVVTAAEPKTAEKIRDGRRILGTCLSPMNAFLLSRGINTLPLRVSRHSENARAVAEWLSGRDWVESVSYPGLPGRQHDVLRQFASGFGGLVSFRLRAGLERHGFASSLRRIGTRYSFGEPRSSILLQSWTDVIRLSVGWEDPVKLTDDLQQAFLTVRENAEPQGALLMERPSQHPSRVG